MNKISIKYALLAIVLFFGVITCIQPLYPSEQFLQHIGTLFLLWILIGDLKHNKLTVIAFASISVFTLLHIIGARYIYSYVPYNEWFKFVLGIESTFFIQSSRNHYDRFVHFSFGLLFFPYFYEKISSNENISLLLKVLFTWTLIQSASMIYELFEWALTLIVDVQQANDYNGQQGDNWDAQKDMFFALTSSTFMALFYWINPKMKNLLLRFSLYK